MTNKNKIIGIIVVLLVIAFIVFLSYKPTSNNNINVKTEPTNNTNEDTYTEITTDYVSYVKNSITYPATLKDFYYNLYVLSNKQTNFSISEIEKNTGKYSTSDYYFLVNSLYFEYTNDDNFFSVEFKLSDNQSIRNLIPYIILALDSNTNNETAVNYATNLVDSFEKYKGSDIIEVGNYIMYIYPKAYVNYDTVSLNFLLKKDSLANLDLNEYKNLTYEQLLNPMYKGSKTKITLTVSLGTVVDTSLNGSEYFEATDSLGNEYKITYAFDNFHHWFVPSEQYEFYCYVCEPLSTPLLSLEGYKKL